MKSCTIEKILIESNPMPHDMVSRIFEQRGTALVAVGSLACIRTLWFRAYRLGKLHRFFSAEVSDIEYALGKQISILKKCIREAVQSNGIRHIIVYASCLEVVTMCNLEEELADMKLPEKVSLHVFYRGPLVKRSSSPAKMLDKILNEIRKLESEYSEPVEEMDVINGNISNLNPPSMPDFAQIMMSLKNEDCDVLLLSPGGCKSCMEETNTFLWKGLFDETNETKNDIRADFYGTRFNDISICQGCEELYTVILNTLKNERPLFLVGSAVFHMIGFDGEYLAERLNRSGKKTTWIESNGF